MRWLFDGFGSKAEINERFFSGKLTSSPTVSFGIQPVVTVSFLEMKIFFANDRYGADQSGPRLAGHGTEGALDTAISLPHCSHSNSL
jgi:hypothetical protein